jgi:hypothetical protein
LKHDDSERLVSIPDAPAWIANHHGRVVLITRARRYSLLKDRLPKPRSVDRNSPEGYVVVTF